MSPVWRAYAVAPETVEFWQGATDRLRDRLIFRRNGAGWDRELLWP
ncbi:pyridoxine 5'-phosphate oxidase C-terminal domain-containing protein [Paracoccus pantotrophus]|nr:pyridoxine 5'-phosphate oxidase C-terminal domain-containing protein [Paracoccus pantotrophus]